MTRSGRRRSGHGVGETTGDGYMEANPLGAEPSAIALDQRVYGNGYPQPAADRPQQGREETERGPSRLISGLIHRGGTLLLLGGVTVAQVAWIAMLAYGVYWIGGRLPLLVPF